MEGFEGRRERLWIVCGGWPTWLVNHYSAISWQTLGTGFHKIVQANSHCKRVVILRDMLQREHDKLRAKSTFQSGF